MRGTPSDLESDGGEAAVQRTHLLVTHLTAQIDALGQQQETYHRDCTTHQARTHNTTIRTPSDTPLVRPPCHTLAGAQRRATSPGQTMPHPLQARNAELRTELQRLQADNAVLAHRVAREREKARDSEREGTALHPLIMATHPWYGYTPATLHPVHRPATRSGTGRASRRSSSSRRSAPSTSAPAASRAAPPTRPAPR